MRAGIEKGTLLVLAMLVAPWTSPSAQARPVTRVEVLAQLSGKYNRDLQARRPKLYYDLLRSTNPPQQRLNDNPGVQLMFIDEHGRPVFNTTENLNAAATISTKQVWPGESGGFSLTGSATALGKLGIWDGGGVLTTHQEFDGRVLQVDSPSGTHFHATHVAGTMVAEGQAPAAKGMSFEASLVAYDWDNDNSEMTSAANIMGMNVSNHSYSYITGWYHSGDWYWFGDITVNTTEDYGFGFYDTEARTWDEIAYNAPYYTICKAAGNDRDDAGPGPGGGHWVWNGGWVWSTDTRDPDGGTTGYDCISWRGNAKNIITVGAVDDIVGGYSQPSDVVMSSFSAWGPTDDGRIKPDLVANGIQLYSCVDASNSSYASYSGTSMATPNLSGSLNLLVRHYEATHGDETPLSSTMKAILIQTADEAGPNPGPDYMFGWGLMNTLKAAQLIQADSTSPGMIREESLSNGQVDEYYLYSDGTQPVRISIAWTDPPGTPPPPSLDPPDLMLVNDLDLRVEHLASSTVFYPYILDPANPAAAATKGDNFRDNLEQVFTDTTLAGTYRVTVTHKGMLASAQDYSIVSSEELIDCQTPVAGFSADQVSICAGGTVCFTDESAGSVDTWYWDFGDGDSASTQNPCHIYETPGLMTVKLKVSNTCGSDSVIKTDLIQVRELPQAKVYAEGGYPDTISGLAPFSVCFSDSSSGYYSNREWDFGGHATAAAAETCFTFAEPETVLTTLRVWGDCGQSTDTVLIQAGARGYLSFCQDTIWVPVLWRPTWIPVCITSNTDTVSQFEFKLAFSPDSLNFLDSCKAGDLTSSPPWEPCWADSIAPDTILVGVQTFDVPGSLILPGNSGSIVWVLFEPDGYSLYASPDTVSTTLRIADPDLDVAGFWCGSAVIKVGFPTPVGEKVGADPRTFSLGRPFPNPFNPLVSLRYEIPERSRVKIQVFDVSGRLVKTLTDGVLPRGRYIASWDGRNESGRAVSSSVYYFRMRAPGLEQTRKVVLLK